MDLADAAAKITDRTKIVAVTHASNVMGTVTPLNNWPSWPTNTGRLSSATGPKRFPT